MLQLIAVQLCCFWRHKTLPLHQFKLVDFQQSCKKKIKNEYWLGELSHSLQWFGSNRCVPLPIQTRQGLPTMCLIVYFAVFGMSPSLQISIKFCIVNDSIHLRSAEVLRGSDVCPSLMFPSDTITLKSSCREFCGSDSRSFPIWPIIQPMLK